MCGIAAVFEPHRRFDPRLLGDMEQDLFHRGPDSGGILDDEGYALIFRRLAILDPQARADQPMTDPSGNVTLVYNGEIYNFRELRTELVSKGIQFRTEGDTEVILLGYLTYGVDFLAKLEGMFALVLVDRRTGVAIAARDRLGIKPLYLHRNGSLTAFASEVRPLLRLCKAEVDPEALPQLMTFGWAAGRVSNYKDIERVPGGTILTIDLQNGTLRETRFANPLDALPPSGATTLEEAEASVERSIADHMVSDVGYALQLSGGVDSSLIAAIVAGKAGTQIRSYSVGLNGHDYDEGPYQDMVASQYDLDHRPIDISPSDYANALPTAIRHMEGPTPHGGCTMLMLLCGHIRDHTKVVLTGEGADELFGGYQRYAVWRKTAQQEKVASAVPAGLLPSFWPFLGAKRLQGLDAAAYSSVYHDFKSVQSVFPGLIPAPAAREATSRTFKDFRDRLLAVDQTAYLESLLVRQDKMSMAKSVEARVPFTHHPLYATVNGLPHDIRIPGKETKPVLKAMAARYLPHDLVYRRKIGLWLPYHEWYRDSQGAGRYLDLLRDASSRLAVYAEKATLNRYVENVLNGGRSAGLILQRLVELELWMRTVDGETIA